MLIDTHSHLDYPDFEADLEEVLAHAKDHGVGRIITIGTGIDSSRRAIAMAEAHPEIFAVVGVHPTNVNSEDFAETLRELGRHPKVVAIGETGLDYHRLPGGSESDSGPFPAFGSGTGEAVHAEIVNGAYKSAQAEAFKIQLDIAVDLGLNVVIHQRDAWDDTLAILRPYSGKVHGVFHCFGGTPDQALTVIEMGHLVSFTGIVTFKNATQVRDTVAAIPADKWMVETDCPYLAPVPHRGARCEPWHTALVAGAIAKIRGISNEEAARLSTATAESFFRRSCPES